MAWDIKNGYYISSSSGNDGAKSGHVTTGMIPYAVTSGATMPPTIYIKGGTPDRIGAYLDGKTFKSLVNTDANMPVTTLGTNYYCLTPARGPSGNSALYENLGNIRYLRFDCIMTDGADLIITKNEPIE